MKQGSSDIDVNPEPRPVRWFQMFSAPVLITLVVLLLVIIGSWICNWVFVPHWFPAQTADGRVLTRPDGPGTFGDMFGAVSSLFGGLSFFGVVIALMVQTYELKQQRQDQMAMLDSIRNLSNMQVELLNNLQVLTVAQSRESKIMNLQSMIGLIDEKLKSAQRQMPSSWVQGSPEAARREQLKAEIEALKRQKDSLETQLREASNHG